MGRIRNYNYDAVIGIGGKSTLKNDSEIKYKINWIGLGPKRIDPTKIGDYGKRGNLVVFNHFELYDEKGKNIKEHYPCLFNYMYVERKRFDMSSNIVNTVFKEVEEILDSIKDSAASKLYNIESSLELKTNINTNLTCPPFSSVDRHMMLYFCITTKH